MIVLNISLLETERPLHRRFRENHAGEIRLLQEFNQATRNSRLVSDDIKKNAPAVPSKHDSSMVRLVGELGLRAETGVAQNFSQVNRALDRGKAMIGD